MILLLLLLGCKEDESQILPYQKEIGNGSYYRLSDFGSVDVYPEHRQVSLLIRVTDSLNLGVTNLDKDDFKVLENNEDKVGDLEANTKIDPETIPFTIKTVLLLDLSSSVESEISNIKSAVKELIAAKVNHQEFSIFTFDSEVKQILDFTSNGNTLISAINNLPETGFDNSTNLYQAIITASKSWQDIINIDEIEEGSMIVFTDGKHNADPHLNIMTVLNSIENKSIYAAALNSPNLDEASLLQIVGEKSRYHLASNIGDLANVFLDIQDRILTQSKSIYYITYTSPISVPGVQNLKIMIDNNRNPGGDCMIEKSFSSQGF